MCNSENRVVGTELRSEVHRRGLFHRAVNIVVWNSQGQLLLQQRAPDKDVCPSRCGQGRRRVGWRDLTPAPVWPGGTSA